MVTDGLAALHGDPGPLQGNVNRSRTTPRIGAGSHGGHLVMAQSSMLGRVGQLGRANVNALLDSAEDPEKMLDQMVRDYTESIREAEAAVAQTIGNLRLPEDAAREAGGGARGGGGGGG